jgi:ATP-dependent DNA ligase
MKPEYSNMVTDLDLVILGAYFGDGKGLRGSGLSSLLLGVKNSSATSNSASSNAGAGVGVGAEGTWNTQYSQEDMTGTARRTRYETLTRIGTGYSFEQLVELRDRLKGIVKPYDPRRPPPHLAHWKARALDRPDCYIPPEESIVVTIKCAEIVPSAAFSAGYTCRFPRIVDIRYDKPVADILSLSELREIKDRPLINKQVLHHLLQR